MDHSGRNRRRGIIWFALLTWLAGFSALADPQLSASASLTPTNATAGDTVTFQFTVTNSIAPGGDNLTNSHLEVACPISAINGVPQYLPLVSVTAPGGAVNFIFDGSDLSRVEVNYAAINQGVSRTFSASFQIPVGLMNGSVFTVGATLTWDQPPGTLYCSSSCVLFAAPVLQVSLAPAPLYASPGARLSCRAQYVNQGSGITRKAWLVIPIPAATQLIKANAVETGPTLWCSTTAYSPAQANSDGFIRSHFTPAIFDSAGTPGDPADGTWVVPPGTKTLALLLDDPNLNLLPTGLLQEFVWQIEDNGSPVGTVIEQSAGIFSDDWSLTYAPPRQTTIRLLPADLTLVKLGNSMLLTFVGDTETSYQVQRSGNLTTWSNLGAATQTNPGFFQFTDSDPLPGLGFYRLSFPAP